MWGDRRFYQNQRSGTVGTHKGGASSVTPPLNAGSAACKVPLNDSRVGNYCPYPVKLIAVCGPPLVDTLSVPFCTPAEVGAKVTVIVQADLAARVGWQLLVWENHSVPAPTILTVPTLMVLTERLVSVTGKELDEPTATVPKLRLVGEYWVRVPTPDKLMVCGLVEALSLIVMDADGSPGPQTRSPCL